jgi:hypothetical protein
MGASGAHFLRPWQRLNIAMPVAIALAMASAAIWNIQYPE